MVFPNTKDVNRRDLLGIKTMQYSVKNIAGNNSFLGIFLCACLPNMGINNSHLRFLGTQFVTMKQTPPMLVDRLLDKYMSGVGPNK
jgi:hypothetical protein